LLKLLQLVQLSVQHSRCSTPPLLPALQIGRLLRVRLMAVVLPLILLVLLVLRNQGVRHGSRRGRQRHLLLVISDLAACLCLLLLVGLHDAVHVHSRRGIDDEHHLGAYTAVHICNRVRVLVAEACKESGLSFHRTTARTTMVPCGYSGCSCVVEGMLHTHHDVDLEQGREG
jgi:hypothetical protein